MKKVVCLLLAAMLSLAGASALAEGVTLRDAELPVDHLEYVDQTRYLIGRDAETRLYGLYSTAGEALIPCEYGFLDYAGFDCFEVINEEGLNNHALIGADGRELTAWEYAAFEVISDRWCLAVVLEPTEGELYDYSGGFMGGGDRYLVTRYDVIDLKAGQKVGSLDRAACGRAVAHGDYLYVEDREEAIHVYDETLTPVDAAVEYLHTAYDVEDGKATCLSDGKVIAENVFSVSEDSDTGYIKVRGNSKSALVDAEGNVLIPMEFDSIGTVYDDCAPVENDGMKGLYDIAGGRLAVPCEYDDILYFGLGTVNRYAHNGYVCVQKGDKVGFADLEGNVTCELKYAASGVTQHGCTLTVTDLDGAIYIVAGDGTQTRTDYSEISKHSGGDGSLLVVAKDDAYGLVDWHGNIVLPLEYKSYDITVTDYADAVILDHKLLVRE